MSRGKKNVDTNWSDERKKREVLRRKGREKTRERRKKKSDDRFYELKVDDLMVSGEK